jgi:hypothetical protein
MVVTASFFAAMVLSTEDHAARGRAPYSYVEKRGDLFAYTPLPADNHVSAQWFSVAPVDRVLLVRSADADRILAGRPPVAIIQEWRFEGGATWGFLEFEVPTISCPPPPDTCVGSDPVLVWMRGNAWVGTPERSFTHVQEKDLFTAGKPLYFEHSRMHHSQYVVSKGVIGATLLLALVCMACVAAWGVLARRSPRPRTPSDAPFRSADASDMLRLVRLAELYVTTISRYFLLSGLAIVLATGLVMYLAFPPLLAGHEKHFGLMTSLRAGAFLTLIWTPGFVAAVAALFWATQLREVRQELARWRRFREGLDQQAAAMLAP